ncbi:2-oxo-4-hydroxy-4-carboxy-5-ureidoimidazoline decarboxylase [Asanoa ferruginea]|uniref:2-oxo-4-hydroxy-4-carboxy-5-ureidoimidazoline decarboxylase n=1 Tax=Asanoa ferruginea TaxID=53367 RepID=UPI000E287277|nr:2-oxo-4-hydroxy-4-carboxy-5-ureidoimidazoline decarboxylase [Asanoa ferruginea]
MADVDRFNRLPPAEAERELLACCAAPAWVEVVAAGRPYPDRATLLAAADAALRRLTWAEVSLAISAHPRIGERPAGGDRESAWSRREQAGVAADADTRTALKRANLDYERRFDQVFLIFATGKSQAEILDALRHRLDNDDETERRTVQEELRKIALLRLERLVTDPTAPLSTHVLDLERGRPAAGVPVRLERGAETLAKGRTDDDGRLREWVPEDGWAAGDYRLVFDVAGYLDGATFFPEITIGFRVTAPDQHHHVPLLLNRHGYTTYRGS